ncbi:MAG TPA: DUF4199 domain-containing protein [Opitutaceae bacterium]|nr:DUF4199 domain-containing protein [Opitutaceae bacterium]
MKIHVIYGLGIALAGFLLMLLLNLAGLHSVERFLLGMILGFLAGITVTIIGLVLGIRAVRKSRGSAPFSYGQALVAGILISVVNGIFGAGLQQLYTQVINPHFNETVIQWTQAMMEKAEMPPDEIENAIAEAREKSGAGTQIRNGIIGAVIFGTLCSLIVAIFLRRPGESADAPAPA